MEKEVLILTKSEKNKGYCVAGIDIETGNFIRLVGNEKGEALDKGCCNFSLLDILKVSGYPYPLNHQTENFLIEKAACNKNLALLNFVKYVRKKEHIFYKSFIDTDYHYIYENHIHSIKDSIAVIEVSNAIIYKNEYSKNKIDFIFRGKEFKKFSMTDSRYYGNNEVKIEKAILVISIPERPFTSEHYEGKRYYKFVSAVYNSMCDC